MHQSSAPNFPTILALTQSLIATMTIAGTTIAIVTEMTSFDLSSIGPIGIIGIPLCPASVAPNVGVPDGSAITQAVEDVFVC
jgi:hypothetical protein